MRTPADDGPPLYVPAEFEAEHLDDARRTVIRSLMRRGRRKTLAEQATDPRRRWRAIAVMVHLIAAVIAMVFAAVTGTWVVGVTLLVAVLGSLAVSLPILTRLERNLAARRHGSTD